MRPIALAALSAIVASALPCATARAEPAFERVREHYVLHCSGCHGMDGDGVPGTVPSLRHTGHLLELPGGRSYLGQVPGVAQAPLGDHDLARLLNWVVQAFSAAPVRVPYSAEEVGRLRATPLRDPGHVRNALVRGARPRSTSAPPSHPAAAASRN